jgi:hypothetical protein
MSEEQRQYLVARAQNDLDQLAQFHNIFAILCFIGMLCGLPHTLFGFAAASGAIPVDGKTSGDPFLGGMFVFAGVSVMVAALTIGLLNLKVSEHLAKRTGRMMITVVSALNFLAQPIGLALGIYTLVVISRAEVKELIP